MCHPALKFLDLGIAFMAAELLNRALSGRIWYLVMPVIFIGLIPLGLIFNVPWLGLIVGAVVVPVADELIGRKEAQVTGPSLMEIRCMLVSFLLILWWSLGQVARLESWPAVILAGASSGYVLGIVGIPAAHELGHRRLWLDKLLGQCLLACIWYGHYQVAHSRHHIRVCLPDDPATARREETLWKFFPRYFVGIWKAANEVATRFRGYRHYEPVLLLILSGIILCLIAVFFGQKGFVFWMTQTVVGLFLIGSVDYIQHWGLRRKLLDNGRYERTGLSHSWESPFWLSERITCNLTRHNFHHLAPSLTSDSLERIPSGPQMPLSYGTMVLVASIPSLFRKLMEPRLSSAESEQESRMAIR
jgi:alkane 1-monooxygenase